MIDLMMRRSRQIATVCLAMLFQLALTIAPGYGQSTTGQILGTVADASGGVLPGATITVTNIDTGQTRSTTSEATGSYAIPLLPPGQYRVEMSLDGFKQTRYDAIRLEVGQNQRVDGRLELGSISEQITVTGETVFVDTNSASVGTVIDRERLEKLPMVGRGVLNLALLTPGVGSATLPPTNVNQRQGPTISASGARPNQSNVMLDGASLRTAAFNTAQSLPSPDSLQEFQVLTSTYPAEYGEAGGATLMAITKSGTNNFSGTAWEYFRNDAMSQKNFFAPSKAELNQNQFGATFGGPIFQNRTFFFGNYEALRIKTQTILRYFVPTAAQRAGDFSNVATPLRDPLGGTFPGNQIPVSRFDPMSVNITNTYLQLPTDGAERIELADRPTDGNQVTFKIDHRFTDSDTVNVRYYWNKTNGTTANGNINSLAYDISNVVQGTAASTTKIYRNNLIGEGRFTYTTITTDQGWSPNNKSPEELGALWRSSNLPEPAAIVPQVSVTGGGFSLTSSSQNWNERGRLAQVDYKMSWSPSRHAVTFGGSYHWQQNRSYFPFQVGGVIPYNGSVTGNAMADFVLGYTANFSQYSCFCSQEDQTPIRLYVQDDVKLGRVTLNLGLRYEAGETWVEKDLLASTFRQDQQSTRFPNAPRGLVAPGDAGIPDTIIEADKNNFAPRLGVAWDVRGNGRTSLRAGWGVYYLPMPAQAIEQQNENVPFTQNVVFAPRAGLQSYNVYAGQVQPFPFLYDETADPKRFTLPTQVFNYNPGFRTAFMRQYNVNLQQQIGQDLIAMVGYVGSQGRNMLYGREINAAVYGPGATPGNAQSRRPIDPTSFSSMPSYFSDSESEFNSMQLTLTKRYSRGYTLQGSYALAFSKDDRSQTSTSASAQSPYDPHDGEWAYSDFDRRHIMRINGVWELPWLTEPSAMHYVLGGWRVAGIFSMLSGQPINVTSGVDRVFLGASSRGLGPQRPDQIKEAELPTDRPQEELIAAYFDKTAFVLPAVGSFGNTPRNSITGPGAVTVDMSLVKRFAMDSAARRALELRIEVFNLFNRVNLNNPVSALNSGNFGRITTAGDARLAQLGLHFTF
jgi:hypothetical protein